MWWPFRKFAQLRSTATLRVRAKFDAAQTTPDNRRHWANADRMDPNAAANPSVRAILRSRARYEVANNSYARGIVLTLANDVVGTGPRLQMLTGDAAANRAIERAFAQWADDVDLAAKLRTMRMARAQDGETFAMLFSNPELPTDVKLDVRIIEADQVTTPATAPGSPGTGAGSHQQIDGIVFDRYGNAVEYHLLKQHPGSAGSGILTGYDRIPARAMLHWFRADRPGQYRGLPDILPALPLFAQLRRYTLAVIAAAESAANIAILMKTTVPASGSAADVDPMTEMEFTPNMAVFAPEGWESANQS
jgi:capsid protein